MSAIAHAHPHPHENKDFLFKYVFSMDHKMISKQFMITGMLMGLIGMTFSILFRLQLGWPGESFSIYKLLIPNWAPGGVLSPDKYLALVTMHGTIMVFFLLTGGLSGTYSNLLIPYQIGARDMASGFLNMLSYWFFLASCIVMISSFFVQGGPASGGWTIYPPLSALPEAIPGSAAGMTLWIISLALFITSALLGGLNYVTTIVNLRTKGMRMSRLPLTIWSFLVTAVLGLLTFPVLFACVVLLMFDRSFGTSFFLSDIFIGGKVLPHSGGSPILFEHLFWFLGHPEVYIVLLPSLGISSEIFAVNCRKPIFGYRAMAGSLIAIGMISLMVWGHHMFVSGMNPFLGAVFTFTTLLVAIPSAVKVFNYLGTLWKGNIRFTPAMLFAVGMLSCFISGGLTGIVLGDSALDINVHDTYFVIGHFHIVMGMVGVFSMYAGIYHWFPKMFGKMMNNKLGYAHFWITIIGIYCIFIPMHYLGYAGMPRRYYSYTSYPMFKQLLDLNTFISMAAIITGLGQSLFLINFLYSAIRGPKAPQNPWKANTLEWTTPVEHVHGNWPGELPIVYRWPYDYSKPGYEEDFVPQTVPLKEGEIDEGE